jgi:CHAT domain-containing protein
LHSSTLWGNAELEHGQWHEAIHAFGYGVKVIDQILAHQVARSSKATWLKDAQELYAGMAYAFCRIGQVTTAVEHLEHGRARLMAETMERQRRDLERLQETEWANLYQEYLDAVNRLALFEPIESGQGNLNPSLDISGNKQQMISDLDAAIQNIRQVPGFEHLFTALTFDQIRENLGTFDEHRTSAGVYLIVHQIGSLALIVHRGGAIPVWLNITRQDLVDWLVKVDGALLGGLLGSQLGDPAFTQKLLQEALEASLTQIGTLIAQPLATGLREKKVEAITIIPTGLTALLPLNAAPYEVNRQGRILTDEFVVRYAPSAQTLEQCRKMLETMSQDTRTFLGIANPLPLPENFDPLVFSRFEVEKIASLFSPRGEALCETTATRTNVETRFGKSLYLHLSCHGMFNVTAPLESGILLSNREWLTVRDLLGSNRLLETRLAILSACQTAVTDYAKLPEEAIGLPSGFLQAGVPGVIGTLWPVNDFSTAILMIQFYKFHLLDRLSPPDALRHAQLWLRDATNADLAELFVEFNANKSDPQSKKTYGIAQEKFRKYVLADSNARPFAHPYYWAAFVFYGA